MEPQVKKLNVSIKTNEKQSNTIATTKQVENILTYDVLRIIFKHLSAKDLNKVSILCRSWRDAANSEADTRRFPEYHLKCFQVVHQQDSNNSSNAKLLGNELKIKPSIGLICAKVQEQNEWIPEGCYCENLPNNCKTIILGGYDIVADNAKIEENKFGLAVCTFLPEIPNLSHKILHVDKHTFNGSSNIDINAHADNLIKQLLPTKSEKSKCIIMLTNQEGYNFTKIIMKGLQKRYKPGTISLWGGVCVDLKLCEPCVSSRTCSQVARWTAITLSSPSLQTWSVVLVQSFRKENQIREKLEHFRENIHLKKYALGLMFACCERLSQKETEIRLFKQIFPQVPLVGLYGDGEYGLNTLCEKRESRLQLAYSTIFLILTYQ